VKIYVERGSKRTFACAVDWPGWARSGRSEDDALHALVEYGPRFAAAIKGAANVPLSNRAPDLDVAERLEGDAGTDFGIPSREWSGDARTLSPRELERQVSILRAAWAAFDAAAERNRGAALTKGPRGGGRDLDRIVRHVLEGEIAYFNRLGGRFRPEPEESEGGQMARVRADVIALLKARRDGKEPPMGRRKAPLWSLRYFIRRSAWHALDHAWEIEDRARA
jgi:hypothetical protein